MTVEIAFVYLVLGASLVLFISEKLRVDLVALLVLSSLAITGLVTPGEAFSGFSNPAVITVWAMFIISQGLANTGVANRLGRQVMQLAGRGEVRLVGVITVLAAMLSAFMNNIGVAALLLPVTMDISRSTGIAPSRLLMPMAFGSLLGGLTTMIGTPPNLLVSDMMRQAGFEPFEFFDFSLMGVPILLAGVLFFQFVGRHLLPVRSATLETERHQASDLQWRYGLEERTFQLRVPEASRLIGQTIAATKLATSAGLKVIATTRDGEVELLPPVDNPLTAGERLLVQGRVDRLNRLRDWSQLIVTGGSSAFEDLVSNEILLFEVRVAENASLIGRELDRSAFREKFHGNLLGIRRHDQFWTERLSELPLEVGDRILVQGGEETLELLEDSPIFDEAFEVDESMVVVAYELPSEIHVIEVPDESSLVGQTLADSGIGELFEFTLLALERSGVLDLVPDFDQVIQSGDRLLVRGTQEQVDVLRALQEFEILSSAPQDLGMLESERMAMVEASLAPRSSLADKTVAEIDLKSRFGVELMAIWRKGRAYRSELNSMQLKLGDALLLLGPRDRLKKLEDERDFLVLTPLTHQIENTEKAPIAAAIMAAIVLSVLLGWLPISVAAVAGGALMVLLKCLTMEEAYRAIEWRSIFLIAGMLPLGIALDTSGGAAYLANSVMTLMSGAGPMTIIMTFYLITALATLFVPTAALVVLMGPIVMTASADLGIHPQSGMMAVAIAASASFASPVSHPANLLIMGPGGYRFADYLKLGLPLTLLIGLVTAVLLPFVWPPIPQP